VRGAAHRRAPYDMREHFNDIMRQFYLFKTTINIKRGNFAVRRGMAPNTVLAYGLGAITKYYTKFTFLKLQSAKKSA
ncbi:MAG: hypothetical protein IJD83_00755, partial [Clostridia bacterium]|nr:hypothetical protein [Clostridia bacterium]